MAPIKETGKKKSWSEINKSRKEEKRKWKEQNLMKKFSKKQEQQVVQPADQKAIQSTEISTVSIAVPGSILENAQSPVLRTYLAGQIARAAAMFQIDEVIVFDDYGDEACAKKSELEDESGLKLARESCVQLGRILQYLECPQYLRKHFFPIHKDLGYSGVLNPLNAPHHLTRNEEFEFREGVVTNKPVKPGRGSIVNIGLLKDVYVDKLLPQGVRCTVRLLPQEDSSKKLKGLVVKPTTPREETGVYWGYTIRLANSLSKVFSQSPYKGGYDVTIGTSDKGTPIDEFTCPQYKHLLIMFGGVQGLELALENDEILQADDPSQLFDFYLNTLPNQGSKTIRTEEAILVTLSALRPKLNLQNPPKIKVRSNTVNLDTPSSSSQPKTTVHRQDLDMDMSRFD